MCVCVDQHAQQKVGWGHGGRSVECESACRAGQMGPHDHMHMGPHDYMHMGPHDSCSHPTEGKGAGCGDEHALQGREGRVRGGGMMIKVATPVTHHQGGHSGYPPIRSGFKHFGFGGFKDPTHCEWGLDRPLTWVPLPPNPPTH